MDVAAEIRELPQQVQEKIDESTSFVSSALSKVPDVLSWVIDRFMEAWDWMLQKLGEFWDWFADKLSYVGNPFLLNGASTGWRESVAGPMTNVTRTIDDAQLAADDVWEGFGAEQYRQHLPAQRAAMAFVADDFANTIASVLDSLQTAIPVFWAGVVVAVAGIAAATAAGATIVGIPAVPATVAAAIGTAIVAMGAALAIMYSNLGSARSTLAATASGIQSWPPFAS